MNLYDLLCLIEYEIKITIYWRDIAYSGFVHEFLDNEISGFPIHHHYVVNEILPEFDTLKIFVRG